MKKNKTIKKTEIAPERVLDVNLNRCREGLRVVEDFLRYVLNDASLYKKARAIRHNTDKILRGGYALLIKERDTFSDCGRKISETPKKKLPEIIIANFKRAQESLRVLEECSKTFSLNACGQSGGRFDRAPALFKKQRYAAYNAEKAVYLKYRNLFNEQL
ncbi:MAG: hypothetical protein LBU09_02455 [Endomicrobium sp.]|nr:hypothetical protein [Endomicrobium sp.]